MNHKKLPSFFKRISGIRLAALFFFLLYIWRVFRTWHYGDFEVYYAAAQHFREGGPLYNTGNPGGSHPMEGYSYGPIFALLLAPLTFFSIGVADIIWQCFNIALVFRVWSLLKYYLDWTLLSTKESRILNFLIALFTVRFIVLNFDMSQTTVFLLWASLEGMRLIHEKKWALGSAALALGISVKILPVVLLPYLFYRNYWKAGFTTLALTVAFIFVPGLLIGFDYNVFQIAQWAEIINPLAAQYTFRQNEIYDTIHSLSALIPALFYDSGVRYGLRRNILSLSGEQVVLILQICRGLLILFTFYFLRSFPFTPNRSKARLFWEISYLLLIVPLIFPHQQKYGFVMILPAVAYILYYIQISIKTGSPVRALIISMAVVFTLTTLTTDGLIGFALNKITQYYKILTYGVLLLIFPLSRSLPSRLETMIARLKRPAET